MLPILGYEQTTLADIRQRTGASTGSIYHHFRSKEHIAASLYLDGVRQTQEAGVTALLRTRTARTGVAAQVGAYIDWVVEHPSMARFLFAMRHGPFVDEEEEATIDRFNRDAHERAARGSPTALPPASCGPGAGHALGDRVRSVPALGRVVAARHDLDAAGTGEANDLDRGLAALRALL